MSYSSLASDFIPAADSNYENGRAGYDICKITVHHMAGVMTGEQCARWFQNPNARASANYCIGVDGDIVCSVDEDDRAYTSSSRLNDRQAITIEVSDCCYGEPWDISEESWNSLVALVADCCERYDFRLEYDGTPDGSLTRHDMFAATNCPGTTLGSRFDELEETVNAILDGREPGPTPPQPHPTPEPGEGDQTIADIQAWLNREYNTEIDEDGFYGPETKEAMVAGLQVELNDQFDAGLDVDGIFGPATKAACPNVSEGDEGNITGLIQSMLYCLGYNPGELDDIFGPSTATAVQAFQCDNGLFADAIVGKNTFEALFE